MTQLTKNLSREEFACKCGCGFSTVDYELANVCQDLADHFEDVIYINSGCRCEHHNKSVGGARNSKHLLGIAADIRLKHHEPEKVQEYLHNKYPSLYGIGSYDTFTHIDVRDTKARWRG